MAQIDFEISGGGTVYLLQPLTGEAHDWVAKHLPQMHCASATPSRSSGATSETSWAARRRRTRGAMMTRYVKRPRTEPTDEEFLALLILLGPLAYVARWIWRRLRELA
jgi:hypothetical protein